MTDKAWPGTTYGSTGMHKWLILLLRTVNIRIIYGFTDVFVIPFCLLFRSDWRYIYRYLRRRQGFSCLKSFFSTYRNLCLFGQVVVDRFAMYAGRKFKIEIDGYDNFQQLAARKEGFIQLSAHIGNYELAGYSLVARQKRFNALVYADEKETVMCNRERMFSGTNIHMITVHPDGSHVFEINDILLHGDIMSMPADRVFGSSKSIPVSLLGGQVMLPAGPFVIATSRKFDVITVNVMKVRHDTYMIYVTPVVYDKSASTKTQLCQIAGAYAAELERMLKLYPEQWYNYFEMWQQPDR